MPFKSQPLFYTVELNCWFEISPLQKGRQHFSCQGPFVMAQANKLRTPGVLCEILLRILLMGRDFVTVQTIASLSAPGSFSLIKRRGAQKLIRWQSSVFSRFRAWLLDDFGGLSAWHHKQHNNVHCQTEPQCKMGIWLEWKKPRKYKPPIHKPTKPRLNSGLNSLQYVRILFNASWH